MKSDTDEALLEIFLSPDVHLDRAVPKVDVEPPGDPVAFMNIQAESVTRALVERCLLPVTDLRRSLDVSVRLWSTGRRGRQPGGREKTERHDCRRAPSTYH
jgi:hypothetical protein